LPKLRALVSHHELLRADRHDGRQQALFEDVFEPFQKESADGDVLIQCHMANDVSGQSGFACTGTARNDNEI